MEMNEFVSFLETNITEETFEAMALYFVEQEYNIIGCTLDPEYNLKIYRLHQRLTGGEYRLVINFHNRSLDCDDYPEDIYMIAENNTDTLICLCDALYRPNRSIPRFPHCLKNICNLVFSLPKRPTKYYDYKCQKLFYGKIQKKQKIAEERYLKKLGLIFLKCKEETLDRLNEIGLFCSEKDWDAETNTVTLTYKDGKKDSFSFFFGFDGKVTFTQTKTKRSIYAIITDDSDIDRFKEQVIRFADLDRQ